MSQDLVDLTTEFSTTAIDSARRIGSGGFGDVFVVNHRDLGRVALKSFRETGNTQLVSEKRRVSISCLTTFGRDDDGTTQRARREAQTWHRCQHAHILPILGIIDSEKHFFLVSPFAENGSLDVFVLDHPDVDRISLVGHSFDIIKNSLKFYSLQKLRLGLHIFIKKGSSTAMSKLPMF